LSARAQTSRRRGRRGCAHARLGPGERARHHQYRIGLTLRAESKLAPQAVVVGFAVEDAGSPLTGSEVDIVSHADTADLIAKTVAAVTHCIGLGFKRQHIAIITYRGRESSRLSPFDKLGPYPLRAPTDQYDLLGNALFTDGDVLIDSVHRFKGRASPCVVFTEIDFETLDDAAVRTLFVGATRAAMKLVLLVSERAAQVSIERLKGLPDDAAKPFGLL